MSFPCAKCLFFLSLFVVFSAAAANGQTFYGTDDLNSFREGRDKEFRSKSESPLKKDDLANFKSLNYFPNDKMFRVEAIFTRTSDEKYFQMPTSSGKAKTFVKFGTLTFKLNKQNYSLNVYQTDADTLLKYPEYKELLFVPFKDLTGGRETYGGGRYIDIKIPADKKTVLDFNFAYNPNCAYGSDRYSCPVPPKENFLPIEIKAGEKIYQYSTAKQQ